ncbi:uncharacterized protein [Panulirus ornatus]|uniref:uncharacterized protein isoform X2 n=1 Tax=Panulirus ornatus TaxID=150431 RepID=UPI003A892B14
MIEKERLNCPSCRVQHQATSSTQFPISYDMEAVIRKLKVLQLAAESPTEPGESKPRSLIQETEESISRLVSGLRKTLSQLEIYDAQLLEWKSQHEEFLAKINELAEQNKAAIKLLEDERSILLYQQKRGEEGIKRLEATQGSLAAAGSAQDAVTAIDDSDHHNSEAEDWIQDCCKIFPDANTVNTSMKVREAGRKVMDITTRECSWEDIAPFCLGDSSSTIMEKVEILRKLGGSVRAQLEAGRLVAVQDEKDQLSCARLTLQDGQVHLHVLRQQPTPTNAHSLEHKSLMGVLDPSSTLVFLDLAWTGRPKGRVYIRLSPDTGLARQFLLLCTGERGRSYASSRILGVWNKSTEFEMVGGGDYDYNSGQGGSPLLQGLRNCEEYKRPAIAGTVRALHGPESNKCAQFSISTRDCASREWHWAFGQVEAGLDVVRTVVNVKYIREVTVVDCGVVLPL